MARRPRSTQILRFCHRLIPAAAVCVLAAPASAGRASTHPGTAASKQGSKLSAEQKTLHALHRLTFGPRPGDVDRVSKEGLEAWFQQQLHPEQIPDDAFEERLAHFPAMQLSQAELMARFPSPQRLRMFSDGKITAPAEAVEQAIYRDAAFSYKEKREAKQEAKAAAAASTLAATGQPAPTDASATAKADPGLRDTVLHLPPAARVERLTALTPEQMQDLRALLKGPDRQRLLAGLSPTEVEEVDAMQAPERVVRNEVRSTRLLRDVYSERQLQAVMTEFWLNHFSVFLGKDQNEPYLLPAFEREAVRPNALGRFEDLLVATAQSPAMLVYLDNWQSLGPNSKAAQDAAQRASKGADLAAAQPAPKGINENYARELMELHTLGVGGGYTQADIVEVAKCLTGWTIDRPADGGSFQYQARRHEPGSKTVLGHVIAESGENEGLEVLHLLATSPATAQFVSWKLAQSFVSDTPPPALVRKMSKTFLTSNGDIKAVLSTMFHAPEFWSPAVAGVKVKTPLEFVASALRATGAEVTNPVPLGDALDRLGMPLYGKQTPNGYSATAEDWVSSNALLTRMNFGLVLSGNRLAGTRLSWPALLANNAGAPGFGSVTDTAAPDQEAEETMERLLLGGPAAPQTKEAALHMATTPGVQQQALDSFRAIPVSTGKPAVPTRSGNTPSEGTGRVSTPAAAAEAPLATVGGLLLGSPDFQHR